MLLTRECDYGIRIIRVLSNEGMKTVEEICEMEHVPYKYAYKILKKLENSGFVKSRRGRNGGYELIASLRDCTLLDVVTAINDNLYINECLREGHVCSRNPDEEPCDVHIELKRIQEALQEELKRKSIEEIIN